MQYVVFKPLAVLPYDAQVWTTHTRAHTLSQRTQQTHKAAANTVAPVRTVVLAGQQNQPGKTLLTETRSEDYF